MAVLNFPEESLVPGTHITDQQARLDMNLHRTHVRRRAAARAGFSTSTGARLDAVLRMPSQTQPPRTRAPLPAANWKLPSAAADASSDISPKPVCRPVKRSTISTSPLCISITTCIRLEPGPRLCGSHIEVAASPRTAISGGLGRRSMKHHERREEFGKGGALENRGPIHVETLDDLGVGWGADHAGGPPRAHCQADVSSVRVRSMSCWSLREL